MKFEDSLGIGETLVITRFTNRPTKIVTRPSYNGGTTTKMKEIITGSASTDLNLHCSLVVICSTEYCVDLTSTLIQYLKILSR